MSDNRDMQDLVALTRQMGSEGQIRHVHHFPARAGVRAAWPDSVHAQVRAAYHAIGIDEPWQHQAQALEHIAQGATTVVATGTGSGKSLPAWAQALSATCAYQQERHGERAGSLSFRLRRPSALFLCPTKALAVDQLASAHGLVAAGNLPVQVARADGDCSTAERSFAQQHADIVVTNPDFVHYSLLARHQRWTRLLGALSLIVIDEAHAYRGLTGAHVALIVRRLLRVAHRLGARPTVVFLTATVSDPYQLAEAMLGQCAGHIATVTQDTSAAGERHLLWWKPADFEQNDAAHLSAAYARAGARALTFVRARASAEAVAGQIQYLLRKAPPPAGRGGALRYAAYRSGYLPQERRTLEAGVKSGALAGLVTTNALELGIDIAGLDAVVISGWPGSRASIMQQAGRAGRAGRPGIAVFVARDDPLDIYLTDHASQVLAAGAEGTVFDLSNLHILTPHVCAAASEFPLTAADARYFPWGRATSTGHDSTGTADPERAGKAGADLATIPLIQGLAERDLLRPRPQGWMWNSLLPTRAHDLADIRGSGDHAVSIVHCETGELLGTVDAGAADATVHPGATYIHQGHHFRVRDYDEVSALVEPLPRQEVRTQARSETHVHIVGEARSVTAPTFFTGPVEVARQVVGFDRRRIPGGEIIASHRLDMPQRVLPTVATWWQIPTGALQAAGLGPAEIAGALHAAEHALISLLPLLAQCDRQDIGGVSIAVHEQTLQPSIFVYDGAAGGAGFAAHGGKCAQHWARMTRQRVSDCPCREGCPGCIVSPKCGSGNDPLHKSGAITVLELMESTTTVLPVPAP